LRDGPLHHRKQQAKLDGHEDDCQAAHVYSLDCSKVPWSAIWGDEAIKFVVEEVMMRSARSQ
jgi:hypothetical protein